jgi:sigma-B regulation protein RsbQ
MPSGLESSKKGDRLALIEVTAGGNGVYGHWRATSAAIAKAQYTGVTRFLGEYMAIIERNNVRLHGAGNRSMVFAHGFGCDQNMWRFVEPAFRDRFRTVLFDHVGAGQSDLKAYDPAKYSDLQGYADDVVEIGRELSLKDAVFVGHSVSAMIGALASIKAPEIFSEMVMVGPSPRYIDDTDYTGGFTREQIEELLASLADNHMGWSAAMAPAIMGNPDRPGLGEELTNSFCRTDPEIAKQFARATFMSDNRSDLAKVTANTLILQCRDDIIASEAVGEYVNREIPGSQITYIDATGHCPNLSAPRAVIAAMHEFV